MFQPDLTLELALQFSRFDAEHPLAPAALYPFQLDEQSWPTAEHYYQANKFNSSYRQRVAASATPDEAYRLGNRWFRPKRQDFTRVRLILMTRALYSVASQHREVREYLLGSDERHIAETSLYDHFWGVGRDQRGHNHLGKIWMDIRTRLRTRDTGVQV